MVEPLRGFQFHPYNACTSSRFGHQDALGNWDCCLASQKAVKQDAMEDVTVQNVLVPRSTGNTCGMEVGRLALLTEQRAFFKPWIWSEFGKPCFKKVIF